MAQANQNAVKDVAESSIDALEDKVLDGLDAARKVAESTVERTAEVQNQAEESIRTLTAQVADYVQEKPLQAAGIAFAAGVLTTLILSRR